jgi:hypothetical protein
LTSEDEDRLAPALLAAFTSILDLFPVAYRVRVETVDGQTYQTTGPSARAPHLPPARFTIKLMPKDSGA